MRSVKSDGVVLVDGSVTIERSSRLALLCMLSHISITLANTKLKSG
jgi:hypothetical protein